ncbi:MAG: 2-amino-4-hydroxy-6-hydroxymethyldihydropteridine diphosphokinase [Candidatus Marinarcus sp.]|uniref:2-amino-4-hydroxy-6- hydroxymethyldihydropteridine diphosphokinase n=1 Tax=Candidatus Marinarcus sp. TaxID=3100987 RepID=UPI003B003D77
MKKKLSANLTLFQTSHFPYKAKFDSNKKYEVTIGIGGNIGNVKKTFDKLFLCLLKDSRFDILITSPLLLNPPFGFLEQNYFLNGIISLKTNLSINEFFKSMQRFENRFKRTRSFKDAPRTLDIDIIFFANKRINTEKLTIPHKNWSQRESVVIPLSRMYK